MLFSSDATSSLYFLILRYCRCFGAAVSWDPAVAAGASYLETDDTITHQIVDRAHEPSTKYMNRYYVQPQWVNTYYYNDSIHVTICCDFFL